MRKFMVLFLILAVAFSAFAGSNRDTGTAGTSGAARTGSFADYSAGFSQRVTIQIPIYDRGFQGWNNTDNYWTRWIQREFGDKYNVNVQYVAIGRATENQEIPQLLAARRAPTIIFHYDMPFMVGYYGQGVLQNIDWNELRHYAPNFWANSGAASERYGTLNKDNVFFFAERPDAGNYTTIVRKDWVERVGYRIDQITNLETYNDMLIRWRDAGLGKHGTQLLQNNYNYSYAFRPWPINNDERILYSDLSVADLPWAPSKEWLRDMNWKYNNNVLDREFFLRRNEAATLAEFVAGRTGNFGFYITSNRHVDVMNAVIANNPGAEFDILPPGSGIPRGGVPAGRAYWPFGMIMGINYTATEQQRIAIWMFLEWMSKPDVLFTLQNGHNGQNYRMQANGIPIRNADFVGDSTLSPNGNKDYWCWVVEAARFADEETFWAANKLIWSPPGYEHLVDKVIANQRYTRQFSTPDALFTIPLAMVNEYRADLNALFQELYVRIVTAPTAQFEQVYNEAVRQYNAAGYEAILDEKRTQIRAGNFMY